MKMSGLKRRASKSQYFQNLTKIILNTKPIPNLCIKI